MGIMLPSEYADDINLNLEGGGGLAGACCAEAGGSAMIATPKTKSIAVTASARFTVICIRVFLSLIRIDSTLAAYCTIQDEKLSTRKIGCLLFQFRAANSAGGAKQRSPQRKLWDGY